MKTSTKPLLNKLSLIGVIMACTSSFITQATTLYADNFESSLGNWTNVSSGDNKDWTRDSGGTPSQGTGPSTGANASTYYVYLETSNGSAYTAGDTAILEGPVVTGTAINLKFDYHMYGNNIGTLAIDVQSSGIWLNNVWMKVGATQNSNTATYTSVDVDLSSYNVAKIRFRATAKGNYLGDIAIDNILIESKPIGPVAPVFTSNPIHKLGARQDQAYSDSIASYAIDGNGDTLTFNKVSGAAWLNISANGNLSGTPVDFGLQTFIVRVSDGELSNNTTLTLDVADNMAPITISENDFELGIGDWTNVTVADNNDWTRRSGSTPSSNTGPSSGSNSANYIYLETSTGRAYTSGDSAIFQSPTFIGGNIHLDFDYHMYGENIGTLAVDVYSNGDWIDLWSVSGQQQVNLSEYYQHQQINFSGYDITQIRFRATAVGGYLGDIALDNLKIQSIPTGPMAPEFLTDPIYKSDANQDQLYNESLASDAFDGNGDPLTFSKGSGPSWLNIATNGDLSGTPSASDIGINIFEVKVHDGDLADIAILEIYVSNNIALPVISKDSFEANLGHWSNTSSGDTSSWLRNTGNTPSTATGPNSGAENSNFYLYVETSAGHANTAGDSAILNGPVITNGSNIHLTFKYHMYGIDINKLAVDVFDGLSWINDVWYLKGQQHSTVAEAYTVADIDLSSYLVTQVRFRTTAIGGYNGDIAIDDIELTGNGTLSDDSGGGSASKVIFTTNQGHTGKMGGLSGADAICQSDANVAGLSGTFKAFLSDNTTSAVSRLAHSTDPYKLVDGTIVANNWNDLVDGSIANIINLTASGIITSGYAWTGSDDDGSLATYYISDYPSGYQLDLTCNNWTLETPSTHYLGARGKINDTGAWNDWWQNDGSSCTSQLALYCLQQ
ncbi:DUF1554 domain-containing protein [Colwellia sp. TT2012]|uniref:DUF1554 domain-containing protein n=1 Tax=Colwellia sp. TT2012 TaxID=1720342 RepID=UPI0007101A2F|nr:DUF1554 domain-containing protein [Colwellia sp. TT2012]